MIPLPLFPWQFPWAIKGDFHSLVMCLEDAGTNISTCRLSKAPDERNLLQQVH